MDAFSLSVDLGSSGFRILISVIFLSPPNLASRYFHKKMWKLDDRTFFFKCKQTPYYNKLVFHQQGFEDEIVGRWEETHSCILSV